MKIYIATALSNAQSRPFQDAVSMLERLQFEITIRWWEYDIDPNDPEQRAEHCKRMIDALDESEMFLMVLPGKMGAHFELGYATGIRIPTVIWRPYGAQHAGEYPCCFHDWDLVIDGSPLSVVEDHLKEMLTCWFV